MNLQAESAAQEAALLRDVRHGLSQTPKTLPCKYFYDERGSQLFDQICELDEYYLTRSEFEIMDQHGESIASQIGDRVMLVEYGSGSSTKTRSLLSTLEEPIAYVPVDISEEHLFRTADELREAYPNIEILPVVADFTKSFELPPCEREFSHVALYFPGSTIGNFTPTEAGDLLRFMSTMLGPRGGLLIGIDLHKDVHVIEAAYNDAAGVTAEFNMNLLKRINGELNGEFSLDQFKHKAVYNSVAHRVEISLVSQQDQPVQVGDIEYQFERGEEILTEYSHKYTIDGFADFASDYGFSLHKHWTDSNDNFAVLHLVLD